MKNNCVQYAKKSSSCPCINDPYKGNDCLFSSTEQQLCENIEYENKRDGRYIAPEECKNNMTESKVCYYTDDYCNGTECACKCEEQPLCEDIGCEVTAVGECMTTTNHKQNTTTMNIAKVTILYPRIRKNYCVKILDATIKRKVTAYRNRILRSIQRSFQDIIALLCFAKVTIVSASIRNKNCVKILDVEIKRTVDIRQKGNMTSIRLTQKNIIVMETALL